MAIPCRFFIKFAFTVVLQYVKITLQIYREIIGKLHSPASFDGIKRETSENLVRTRHCDMGVVLHMPLMILGRRSTAMIRSQDNCLPGILFNPTGYWGYQYVIILSLEFRSYLNLM